VSFSVGGKPRAAVRLAAADADEEEAIDGFGVRRFFHGGDRRDGGRMVLI
jgi:hypothetical protein